MEGLKSSRAWSSPLLVLLHNPCIYLMSMAVNLHWIFAWTCIYLHVWIQVKFHIYKYKHLARVESFVMTFLKSYLMHWNRFFKRHLQAAVILSGSTTPQFTHNSPPRFTSLTLIKRCLGHFWGRSLTRISRFSVTKDKRSRHFVNGKYKRLKQGTFLWTKYSRTYNTLKEFLMLVSN